MRTTVIVRRDYDDFMHVDAVIPEGPDHDRLFDKAYRKSLLHTLAHIDWDKQGVEIKRDELGNNDWGSYTLKELESLYQDVTGDTAEEILVSTVKLSETVRAKQILYCRVEYILCRHGSYFTFCGNLHLVNHELTKDEALGLWDAPGDYAYVGVYHIDYNPTVDWECPYCEEHNTDFANDLIGGAECLACNQTSAHEDVNVLR